MDDITQLMDRLERTGAFAHVGSTIDEHVNEEGQIQAVIDGKADPKDNVLKNAPHTAAAIASSEWTHTYSREEAVFPLPFVKERKF